MNDLKQVQSPAVLFNFVSNLRYKVSNLSHSKLMNYHFVQCLSHSGKSLVLTMMLNNHFIQFRLPAIVCFAAVFEFTYSFFQPFFFNTVSIHRSYTLFPTESCHTHETDQDGRENFIHPFNMSE